MPKSQKQKVPARLVVVYQHRIQTLPNGEALVRSGKARLATAQDFAIAGVPILPDSLKANEALAAVLSEEAEAAAKAEAAANAAQ